MTDIKVPSTLQVPLPAMVELAVEWWRLSGALANSGGGGGSGGAARHALSRIEDMLRRCELEVQTLDGRAFDPGLAVRVVDVMDDATLAPGQAVIAETLSPMVLWRGQVVKASDVVTRRGPAQRR